MDRHGQANDIFGCDEHLNGASPSHGTEICAVMEAMSSFKEIQGSQEISLSWTTWKNLLHCLSDCHIRRFVCTPTRPAGQPDICHRGKAQVILHLDDSNIFGLEPNFGYCTANMHRGLAEFIVLQCPDDELSAYCLGYAPNDMPFDAESMKMRNRTILSWEKSKKE